MQESGDTDVSDVTAVRVSSHNAYHQYGVEVYQTIVIMITKYNTRTTGDAMNTIVIAGSNLATVKVT
jgi:hypothetical protein